MLVPEKSHRSTMGVSWGQGCAEVHRDIQRGKRALVPRRSAFVSDEEGNTCTILMQQQRWRKHFTNVLNVQSEFNPIVLDKARQRPLKPQMADLPSGEELATAICKMRRKDS